MATRQEIKTVRLRNVNTGAVVVVAEDKVPRLGSGWEAAPVRKTSAAKTPAGSDK